MRRRRLIGPFVSIHTSHLQRTVYIHTDGGRLCRPYIIVENGKTLVKQEHIDELNSGLRKFEDFLSDGTAGTEFLKRNRFTECLSYPQD